INGSTFPIADMAVGRLVELPSEIGLTVNAYLATLDGVIPTPQSSLVTGYDFLVDAAQAISAELQGSIGTGATHLHEQLLAVDPLNPTLVLSPLDPRAWTAVDLRNALLNRRHDVVFLAGHYSSSSA